MKANHTPPDDAYEPKALRFPLGARWRFVARGWLEWAEWFRAREYNWRNFTLLRVAFEAGDYKGRYGELTLSLLGANVEIEVYDKVDRAGARTERSAVNPNRHPSISSSGWT